MQRQTSILARTQIQPTTASIFFDNVGDFAFTTKPRALGMRGLGPTRSPTNAFSTITGIEIMHTSPGCRMQASPTVGSTRLPANTCRKKRGYYSILNYK